jgi:hypothetical protein
MRYTFVIFWVLTISALGMLRFPMFFLLLYDRPVVITFEWRWWFEATNLFHCQQVMVDGAFGCMSRY